MPSASMMGAFNEEKRLVVGLSKGLVGVKRNGETYRKSIGGSARVVTREESLIMA